MELSFIDLKDKQKDHNRHLSNQKNCRLVCSLKGFVWIWSYKSDWRFLSQSNQLYSHSRADAFDWDPLWAQALPKNIFLLLGATSVISGCERSRHRSAVLQQPWSSFNLCWSVGVMSFLFLLPAWSCDCFRHSVMFSNCSSCRRFAPVYRPVDVRLVVWSRCWSPWPCWWG